MYKLFFTALVCILLHYPLSPAATSSATRAATATAPKPPPKTASTHAQPHVQRAQETTNAAARKEAEKKLVATTKEGTAKEQSARTVRILFHPNPGSGIIDTIEGISEKTETKILAEQLRKRIQLTGVAIQDSDFAVVHLTKAELPLFLSGQAPLNTVKLLDKNRLVDLPGGRYEQQIYVTLSSPQVREAVAKACTAATVPKELPTTAPPATTVTTPSSSSAAAAAASTLHQIFPMAVTVRPPASATPIQRRFKVSEVQGQITLPHNAQSHDIRVAIGKAYGDTIAQQFVVFPCIYDKYSSEVLLQTDQPVDSFTGRAGNEDVFLEADPELRKKAYTAATLARVRAEFDMQHAGSKPPLKPGESTATEECRHFFVNETEGSVTLHPKEESAAAIKAQIARICVAQHKKLSVYPFLIKNRTIVLQSHYPLKSLRARDGQEGIALLDPELVEDDIDKPASQSPQEAGTTASVSSSSSSSAASSAAAAAAAKK